MPTYKIQSVGLRPSPISMISDPIALIRVFIWVVICAAFLYWFTVEFFDYYPTGKRIEESFQVGAPIPVVLRPVPRPLNSEKVDADPGAFDMDVLRAHKYYKVAQRETNQNSSPVKTAVWTLQWEVPTTYMLDLLRKVQAGFQTDPLNIPHTHLHTDIPKWLSAFQPGSPTYNPQNPVYTYDRLAELTPNQLVRPELKPLHELIHLVKLHLLTRINLAYLDAGYSLEVHEFQRFAVVKSQWLQVKPVKRDPLALEFTVNIMIHRPLKTHTFNIQFRFTASFQPNNEPIMILMNTLELLGSSMQGERLLGDKQPPGTVEQRLDPANHGSPISDSPNPIIPGADIAMTDNKTNTIDVPGQIRDFLIETEKDSAANTETPVLQNTRSGRIDPVAQAVNRDNLLSISAPYKCFAVNQVGQSVELAEITNPIECQSFLPGIGSVGVWDKPCTDDSDCPFFGKNQNYMNQLGGCDKMSGTCQMPIGVARVGYRYYSKETEPECHNCPSSYVDDKCCKSQAADPKLRGPDLKYMDDEQLRQAFPAVDQLSKLGLKPR